MQSTNLIQEDGFVVYATQKFTQNIMKWAMLCMNTWDCLAPDNDNLTGEDCDLDEFDDDKSAKFKCHNRVKSLLSVLIINQYRNPGIVQLENSDNFVEVL